MRHWRWPAGSGTSAAFSSAVQRAGRRSPAGRVCCGPPPAANGRACSARHCSLPAGLQHALGHLASGRCCIPLLPAESRLAHRAATDCCRYDNPQGRRTQCPKHRPGAVRRNQCGWTDLFDGKIETGMCRIREMVFSPCGTCLLLCFIVHTPWAGKRHFRSGCAGRSTQNRFSARRLCFGGCPRRWQGAVF